MTDEEFKKNLIEAYAKARLNLVNYRHILLVCDINEVKSASYHYDWSYLLLVDTQNTAIQGFRESGKSQYILRSFPLYCFTFPHRSRDYIVLIKNNTTLARNTLKEIEEEYLTNPAINGNLVKIKQQSADIFSVDVMNEKDEIINIRIEAYGKGASIRGLANQDRRPRICIIDDPQDVEDAKSETILENDWNWFLSDVKFLGQYTRIFLISNNLGEKCIIERVFANAKQLNFSTYKVPAIINGQSSWPEKFSLEFLERERESYRQLGKLDVWLRERMCEATSEETRVFQKRDYRYFTASTAYKIVERCNLWATLDPAYGKTKQNCYRAIVVNAVDESNYWYIVDVRYGRWDSAELIEIMFDVVTTWKLKNFGIEKGEFKEVIEPFIYKEMSRRNVFFNIISLEHAKLGSKLERIKMLQPRFKAHSIWFPDTASWLTEMEAELEGVTKDAIKSLFIDLVDALAMQEQIARAPMGKKQLSNLPRQATAEYDILTH